MRADLGTVPGVVACQSEPEWTTKGQIRLDAEKLLSLLKTCHSFYLLDVLPLFGELFPYLGFVGFGVSASPK